MAAVDFDISMRLVEEGQCDLIAHAEILLWGTCIHVGVTPNPRAKSARVCEVRLGLM